MTRARSLSRLANSNAFTVDGSNNVGIGSTQPDVRLDVNGDMNVTGTLTYEDVTNVETAGVTTTGGLVVTGLGATIGGITTFFGDLNFGAAGVGGTITTLGHAEFAGVVTATSFSGDGSALTGVASTENINTSTLAQFTGPVGIADSIFHIGDSNTAIRFPAADTFAVETSGGEALRVDSSKRLVAGADASVQVAGSHAFVQHHGNKTTTNLAVAGYANNLGGPILALGASRSTTVGTPGTIVASGDILGDIRFAGDDGTDINSIAASIRGEVDGTPGSNDMPGRLVFATTADGAASATERLRITSGGDLFVAGTGGMNTTQLTNGNTVNINGTSSNDGFSVIRYSTGYGAYGVNIGRSKSDTLGTNTAVTSGNDLGHITFYGADGTDFNEAAQITAQVDGTPSDGTDMPGRLVFKTSPDGSATPTERVRITKDGYFGINNNAPGTRLVVKQNNGIAYNNQAQTSSANAALFLNENGHTSGGTYTGFQFNITGDSQNRICSIGMISESSSNRDSSLVFHTDDNGNRTEKFRMTSDGDVLPGGNDSQNFGSTTKRWANIFTADLQLSNETKKDTGGNDVDGTWGNYTIQEGENDLFLLNRRNGKKFKFMLQEVS